MFSLAKLENEGKSISKTLSRNIDKLEKIQLRGSQDMSSGEIVKAVREVIDPHLTALVDIRGKMQADDKVGVGLSLKSMLGNGDLIQRITDEVDPPVHSVPISDFHSEQIGDLISPKTIDAVIEHTQGTGISCPI